AHINIRPRLQIVDRPAHVFPPVDEQIALRTGSARKDTSATVIGALVNRIDHRAAAAHEEFDGSDIHILAVAKKARSHMWRIDHRLERRFGILREEKIRGRPLSAISGGERNRFLSPAEVFLDSFNGSFQVRSLVREYCPIGTE